MNKKLKVVKGFMNVTSMEIFGDENVQKVMKFFDTHKVARIVAFAGFGMLSSIAFRSILGADLNLSGIAYADELTPDIDSDVQVETENMQTSDTNASTTDETVTDTVQTSDTTGEDVKQEEISTTDEKTTEVSEEKTTESKSTKKSSSSVEDEISKESSSGKYLKPTYAVDGVDTSDITDANAKVTFKGDKTNCIVFTDSEGNTKIWTLDSYGGDNHGVESNQKTLIKNLENSELTHISKNGTHELVWPGFDYTDDNGLKHCSFDGGEIVFDPNTNEYTVSYDKSKYTSSMGVLTTDKYTIDPDKVDPVKPIEPKEPNTPDNPDTPKKDTPSTPGVITTGDELDTTGIRNMAILGAISTLVSTIGYKLTKSSNVTAYTPLTDVLMTTMNKEQATSLVKQYKNR